MGYTILTPKQAFVVEQASRNDYITSSYYLAGGTALAEFYLHHRISEDIDLFTRDEVNPKKISDFINGIQQKAGIRHWAVKNISGLYSYMLEYADGDNLKIDFNEYDFPAIEKGTLFGKLCIDSVYDIAINKLYTITSRSKARDFVDLYSLIQLGDFNLEQIRTRIPDKFGVTPTDLSFIRGYLAVQEVTDYPTMLVPFDRENMIDFFLAEAKKLESKIFY